MIRLENEHLNNVKEFRATRPSHTNATLLIITGEVPLPFEFINADELRKEGEDEGQIVFSVTP